MARFLSWATRRILRLRMKCKSCGEIFWHLHPLPRTVIGYHGCDREFADEIVTGKKTLEEWKSSQNSYDWLGEGIYFWEYAPGRAWQWAIENHERNPAVVAAEIRLGKCLDLGDTVFTDLLRETYNDTEQLYRSIGRELPNNKGKDQKLRRLDRLIIDSLVEASNKKGVRYQTVRCPFEEGENVYEGAMIKQQSHIQIAVRDYNCISSSIFLVDPMEAVYD